MERRIDTLTALKAGMELMIDGCNCGHSVEYRVIEVLADHGRCAHLRH